MHSAAKKILRLTVSLLLVLCPLLAAAAAEPAGTRGIGKIQKTVLLTPAYIGHAVPAATLHHRPCFKSSDGPFKVALIFRPIALCGARAAVFFSAEFNDPFGRCPGQRAIFIRAPPCFRL
jgi:hypothetical protein